MFVDVDVSCLSQDEASCSEDAASDGECHSTPLDEYQSDPSPPHSSNASSPRPPHSAFRKTRENYFNFNNPFTSSSQSPSNFSGKSGCSSNHSNGKSGWLGSKSNSNAKAATAAANRRNNKQSNNRRNKASYEAASSCSKRTLPKQLNLKKTRRWYQNSSSSGGPLSLLNPLVSPQLPQHLLMPALPGYLGGPEEAGHSPPVGDGGVHGSHSAQASPTSTLKTVRPRARSADETISGKKVTFFFNG